MIYQFLLFFFTVNSAHAITSQQVIEDVATQFPQLQMSKMDIEAAEGDYTAARGAFDIYIQGSYTDEQGDYNNDYFNAKIVKPTPLFGLDLFGGFRRGVGDFAVYDGKYKTLDEGEWSVGARLPLLRNFMIDTRRATERRARIGVEARKFQLRQTELEQFRQSLHRYWDWVFSLHRFRVQKNLLEVAQARDNWLAKRVKHGDIPRFEQDDNMRTILARQSTLLLAEQQLEVATAEFLYFITSEELKAQVLRTHEPVQINEDTEGLLMRKSGEELLSIAKANRPDFKVLDAQLEQNQVDVDLQSNRYWPQLDISAQYSKDRGAGPANLDGENIEATLTFEVPLQYRAIAGRVKAVESQGQRLRFQLQLLQQRIIADLKAQKKQLEVSNQRRKLAQQERELAHRLEEGERLRFRQGETSILIVNLREQASAEAEIRWIESSIEAIKNKITLQTSIGEIPLR